MNGSRIAVITAALVFLLASSIAAQAATVDITGSRFGRDGLGAFPGYGSSTRNNNVVQYGPSNVADPTSGAAWLLESSHKEGAVLSNVANYAIDWYYVGAE